MPQHHEGPKPKKPEQGKRPRHHEQRRVCEHAARVAILEPLIRVRSQEVRLLVSLAENHIQAEQPREAAELLRAAEHLCFSNLAADNRRKAFASELAMEVADELHRRLDKAEERWNEAAEHPPELAALYEAVRQGALGLFEANAYAAALESARAVDAIAHSSKPAKPVQQAEAALAHP